MSFLLDTDTVSFALRGHGRVGERLLQCAPSQVCISAVTLAELRFGADRKKSKKLHRLIDAFVSDIEVAPFDVSAAGEFGHVGALLANHGTSIGSLDVMIAAHALSLGRTLVTHNLRHFMRVPGLATESWV
ncbi:MAG: type II toxin-antitoxin system VapC family toxin [Deltaproteobacteria bacterium]|nr:type II toxin-antitoxin system VapC family toxin [Deltaproteobacteria bacterium]